MKLQVSSVVLHLFVIALITSCSIFKSGEKQQADIVVGEVAGESITLTELNSNFYRSDNSDAADEEGLAEFLDLYLDYKAKLAAARDAGYYNDDEILVEHNDYEKQSVYPYWLEKKVTEDLLDELVERYMEQVHASHILISLKPDASPEDTLEAYSKLLEARNRFLNGEDFDELSKEYSSTQNGQSMGGDLGFFSGGWSVKPFEDVAYNTKPGDVSLPFRTSFGFHVVYVKDRIPRQSERKISHIFFQTHGEGDSEESAMATANEVYDKIKQGEDWADLVMEYTQDPSSQSNEGNIGWIGTGRYNHNFTQSIMSMEEIGSYSEPFFSGYGVHILRLDSIKSQKDPVVIREEQFERLKQLPRYRENREPVLRAARKAGNDHIYKESLAEFEKHESNYRDLEFNQIKWPEDLRSKPLYEVNNQIYNVGDYINWLNQFTLEKYQHYKLDDFLNEMTDEQIVDITKNEYPEYKDLSDNYIHGLVVFRISEDSVWNYAKNDTMELRALYESNQGAYEFGERFEYVHMSASKSETLDQALSAYESGVLIDSMKNTFSGLVVRNNIINNLDDEPFTHLAGLGDGEASAYFDYQNRQNVLILVKKHQPRPMTFDEAYNKLVAEYQPIREQNWLQQLRDQYSVKAFYDQLARINE